MPLLAQLIAGLFGSLASFLVKFVSQRAAIGGAALAAFGGLTVALYGVLAGVMNGLMIAFPETPGWKTGVWLALPDNAPICLAAVLGIDAAVALYRWNVQNVKLAAGA